MLHSIFFSRTTFSFAKQKKMELKRQSTGGDLLLDAAADTSAASAS